MTLLQELKRSKEESERLGFANKLLQKMTEGVLGSGVWQADTSSRYVEWIQEPPEPEPWYVGLSLRVTLSF